jgi:hypothetical protein
VRKIWLALAALAVEGLVLVWVVGVHVWSWVGGVVIGQWAACTPTAALGLGGGHGMRDELMNSRRLRRTAIKCLADMLAVTSPTR